MTGPVWIPLDAPDPGKPKEVMAGVYSTVACPACAAEMFGMTTVDDATICVACRALLAFDIDWHIEVNEHLRAKAAVIDRVFLRHPTDLEEKTWLRSPAVQRHIALVARHHAAHGSPHPNLQPPDEH